jgi:hypothetical protein
VKRFLHERYAVFAPGTFAFNEPGSLQYLDVFAGGRERHGKRIGELADGHGAPRQTLQHLAPRAVSERAIHGVQALAFIFNHMVEYMTSGFVRNP